MHPMAMGLSRTNQTEPPVLEAMYPLSARHQEQKQIILVCECPETFGGPPQEGTMLDSMVVIQKSVIRLSRLGSQHLLVSPGPRVIKLASNRARAFSVVAPT
ncbi:UNVERIFIED_CONTAM: hypothetical protein K2H54_013615 [Gekko kuhli]